MSHNPSGAEIRHLMDALNMASALMASKARPEDIAIFIGTTKAGKSTLINYMLGNELVGERQQRFTPVTITKTGNYGPTIGEGSSSETIIPTRWDNSHLLPDLVLWDAPGFEDNRGPVQDITNAYYIFELFRKIHSVKIVLVVDFNDINTDRVNPFLSLLQSVKNLLHTRIRACFSSIVVAFTKVPSILNDCPVDVPLICEMIDHKILKNRTLEISLEGRKLVAHLMKNPQQIGLFKMAGVGPLGPEIGKGVTQAILGAQSVSSDILRDVVCPSLAEKSQNFLFRSRERLSSTSNLKELIDTVNQVYQEKIIEIRKMLTGGQTDKNELEVNRVKLSVLTDDIDKVLVPGTSFRRKINLLEKVDQRVENKILNHGLLARSELMQFVDKLLGLKESDELDMYIEAVLCNAKTQIQKLVYVIDMKLGSISKRQYEEKMREENEKYVQEIENKEKELKELKEHNNEKKKKMGFCATVGDTLDNTLDSISRTLRIMWNAAAAWSL